MRILQLSDRHLVAVNVALVREHPAISLLERALLEGQREHPDLVLISCDSPIHCTGIFHWWWPCITRRWPSVTP